MNKNDINTKAIKKILLKSHTARFKVVWSVTPPCRTRLVNENRFIVFDTENSLIVFLNKSATWIN